LFKGGGWMKKDVIVRKIRSLERKLAEIAAIMDAKPASDILAMRMKIVSSVKGKTPYEALRILRDAEKKEKRFLAVARKQADPNIISERVRLDTEISELKSELFYIERRNK
jgi:hypothetical protein